MSITVNPSTREVDEAFNRELGESQYMADFIKSIGISEEDACVLFCYGYFRGKVVGNEQRFERMRVAT